MKILFINTSDIRGGAAIVANRLSAGLEALYEAECYFAVARKQRSGRNIFVTRNRLQHYVERMLDIVLNKLGYQYQYFPFSTAAILRIIKEVQPDVISIHNTHGGYFETSLLQKISLLAPVVWTLHDMWSFTGNAAHTFGDESWVSLKNPDTLAKIYPAIGINRGIALMHQKREIYKRSNVRFVTPSRWLAALAARSPLLENKQVKVIPNGVDLGLFQPYDKSAMRLKFDIPQDARVLMFSAEFLSNNPWKGGDLLISAIRSIDAAISFPLHLLVVGEGDTTIFDQCRNFIVHRAGYVTEERKMAQYFSASDLFLYPTKADNLPNVLVEAIACGLPCITFDVGGCSEIIRDGYNGILVEKDNVRRLSEEVLKLIRDVERLSVMSGNARAMASQYFSIESMVEQYYSLFEKTKRLHATN